MFNTVSELSRQCESYPHAPLSRRTEFLNCNPKLTIDSPREPAVHVHAAESSLTSSIPIHRLDDLPIPVASRLFTIRFVLHVLSYQIEQAPEENAQTVTTDTPSHSPSQVSATTKVQHTRSFSHGAQRGNRMNLGPDNRNN